MSVNKSPVYNVRAIPIEKIQANDYNPNVVAPPEMKELSGAFHLGRWFHHAYDEEEDNYILVDGYHRYEVLKTSQKNLSARKRTLPWS